MKASEAFNTVCSMVADKYKDDGWKYAKSSHWMTKKDKKFKYQVRFYTDWNVAKREDFILLMDIM